MAYANWKNPCHAKTVGPKAVLGSYAGWSLSGSAAYVLGSAGNCMGHRFISPVTSTIVAAYIHVHTAPGTANDLRCDVTPHSTTSYAKPDTGTILATATTSGGTVSGKWIKFTFGSPPNCTIGQAYWLIVGDATQAASGYSLEARAGGLGSGVATGGGNYASPFYICSHTSGFSTNGSSVSLPQCFVVEFGDGTAFGSPFNQHETHANNQNERGMRIFINGEDIVVKACGWYSASSSLRTLKCYEDDTLPGGTIYSGFNGGSALEQGSRYRALGFIEFPDCLLKQGHSYRFILDPSANSGALYRAYSLGGEVFGSLLEQFLGALYPMYATEENSGAWKDYNNSTDGYKINCMNLLIARQPYCPRTTSKAYQLGGLLLS